MEAIVPYLSFNGDAAEALDFYARVFNGKIAYQQTFGESPMGAADAWKDKIMHASFQAGDLVFMVSDIMSPDHRVTTGTNMSLSLNFKEEAEIESVFAALSEGAHITMPLEKTFWGAKFGMLTDKFGISWMFNHDYGTKDK